MIMSINPGALLICSCFEQEAGTNCLVFRLQVELLSDADARPLLYESEMGKRREAMRAESAKLGQAELAEPEVAPQVEMAAEAQTPQVCSLYHTCPIVFFQGHAS
jgi:hypothetical protein